MQGITLLTNFEYEEEGIRVWKAYAVGPGSFYSYDTLLKKTPKGQSGVVVGEYTIPKVTTGGMAAGDQAVDVPCPEVGCDRTFKSQEDLTTHIACEVHGAVPYRDTKMDIVKRKWAGRVEAIVKPGGSSSTLTFSCSTESGDALVSAGWALCGHKTIRRHAPDVRRFLEKEFMKGVEKGIKENPVNVARRLKAEFGKDNWLTSQQIMGFFSRMSTRQKCGRLPSDIESAPEDTEVAAEAAVRRSKLRQKIVKEVGM